MAADFLRFGLFTGASALVLSNYVPAGVKFVARIAKRFLGDCVQICDGVDDDDEVNAARDALPAGGGRIILIGSQFNIGPTTGCIYMTKANVVLEGQGQGTSLETQAGTNTSRHVISIEGGAHNCVVRDFHIEGGRTLGPASGSNYVYVINSDYCTIERVTGNNARRHGFAVTLSDHAKLLNCKSSNCGEAGVGHGFTLHDAAVDCIVEDCESTGNVQCGFRTWDYGLGIVVRPKFINCVALSNTDEGFALNDTQQAELVNCTSSGNGSDGFSSQRSEGIALFVNCHAAGNGNHGFFIGRPYDKLTNCLSIGNARNGYRFTATHVISGACEARNNGESGYEIRNVGIELHGCIATDDQTPKTQPYGISFAGDGALLKVFGGDYTGNLTGAVNNWTADSRAVGVRGWVTECNVLSPAFPIDGIAVCTVTIAHGLDITPALEECQLTVTEETNVDDWEYGFVKVESVGAANVVAKVNVTNASATGAATAKLALRVNVI